MSSFMERRKAQLLAAEIIMGTPAPATPVAVPTRNYRLCVSKIIERPGWSRRPVDDLLGEPDEFKPNPKYTTGAPMRLL